MCSPAWSPSPRRGIDLEVVGYACASKHTRPTVEIADYARRSFAPGRADPAGGLGPQSAASTTTSSSTRRRPTSPRRSSQVLRQRRGVCQDFSHLALACLRAMHLPARYVSGYILTSPPPGLPKLAGADASHAWISVWSPEFGWVDFDPTNGLMPRDEHIAIAYGRDYDDVSPISGILLGGSEHSVDCRRRRSARGLTGSGAQGRNAWIKQNQRVTEKRGSQTFQEFLMLSVVDFPAPLRARCANSVRGKNSQYSSSLNHAHLMSNSLRPGTSRVSASA